jgi:hypothetical protein
MTDRQIFSERQSRWPVCVTVALLLVMVAVVLVAGCIEPGYQPNRDVGVVKLTDIGTPDWSTLVTTGRDTISDNIIETSDGSYILTAAIAEMKNSGRLAPRLIRISHEGIIEWETPVNSTDCGSFVLILDTNRNVTQLYRKGILCPTLSIGDYAENKTPNFTISGKIEKTEDLGYIFAGYNVGTPFLSKEEYVNRSQSKYQETKEYAEKTWDQVCGDDKIVNKDGICYSDPVRAITLVKADPDGTVSWQHDFPNYSSDSSSIIEMKDGRGYLALFGDTLIQLSPAGTVTNTTQLRNVPVFSPTSSGQTMKDNDSILLGTMILWFDADGRITGMEPLPAGPIGTSTQDGRITGREPLSDKQVGTPTRDGGFLMVDAKYLKPSDQWVLQTEVAKYNPDGSVAWNNRIVSPYVFFTLTRVIQTSDGGYIILSQTDNQSVRNR